MKPLASCEPIDDHKSINDAIEQLYIDGYYSDVTFVVDGTEFKAHKAILAGQSSVMRKQFKQLEEKTTRFFRIGGNSNSFRHFLGWFYTCRLDVRQMSMETIWDVMFFACDYEVNQLATKLTDLMLGSININTVYEYFAYSFKLADTSLQKSCRQFLCDNAEEVIKNFHFLELPKLAILDLVSNQEFAAPEIDILLAVSCWSKKNPHENMKQILNHIRFGCVKLDGTNMSQIAPVYEMLIANGVDLKRIGNENETREQRVVKGSPYFSFSFFLLIC